MSCDDDVVHWGCVVRPYRPQTIIGHDHIGHSKTIKLYRPQQKKNHNDHTENHYRPIKYTVSSRRAAGAGSRPIQGSLYNATVEEVWLGSGQRALLSADIQLNVSHYPSCSSALTLDSFWTILQRRNSCLNYSCLYSRLTEHFTPRKLQFWRSWRIFCLHWMDTGDIAVLTLFDLSAAFDTVDHATLLRRLDSDVIRHWQYCVGLVCVVSQRSHPDRPLRHVCFWCLSRPVWSTTRIGPWTDFVLTLHCGPIAARWASQSASALRTCTPTHADLPSSVVQQQPHSSTSKCLCVLTT